MGNPTIIKKSEQALTATDDVKRLFQSIYKEQTKKDIEDDIPKIKVSEMVSKMAFYYEKIRNSVDYKEEYLFRKNAIFRILKRKIIIEGAITMTFREEDSEEIAKHLLLELIRAGYLSNNKIQETKIGEVAQIIKKYLLLREYCFSAYRNKNTNGKAEIEEIGELQRWLIAVAASEIEENLCMDETTHLTIGYMEKILNKNIALPANSVYSTEKETQIKIGIYRNYLKYDDDMLSHILLEEIYPDWSNAMNEEKIKEIADDIQKLRVKVYYYINHPLVNQFNRVIKQYTIFFSILIEVIQENPRAVYESFQQDPKAFPRQIKAVYNKKFANYKNKLWTAAIRSIIYIFITKSVFAVLLEVPVARFLGEDTNTISLIINISTPAVLLFLMVLFTKLPSADNATRVVEGVEEIVFIEKARKEPFQLRQPSQRSRGMQHFFGLLYAATSLLTFGLIIWGLEKINFSWISIIIFLFFLALASFFSIRIRKNVKELIILPPKENIVTFVGDFFYVPVVATGKWLSEKFAKINVFVFFLDFIIEAPFKIFVDITEEWTKYVKERKDELV